MRTTLSISLALVCIVGGVTPASAQTVRTASSTDTIRYPLSELGGCTSKDACKAYCNAPSHIQACLVFGKTHNLLNTSDVQKAVLLQSLPGPGGCHGLQCIDYCNASSHATECSAFVNRIVTVSKEIQAYEATSTQQLHTIIAPMPPRAPMPVQPLRHPQTQKGATSSVMSYLGAAVMSAVFLLFPL